MGLAHGRRHAAAPFAVEVAELAVAVAVGMLAAIVLPQQRQGQAAAAQLGMDMGPVRQRLRPWRLIARRREQLALQRRIVELVRDRPSDADHRRAPDVLPDRRAADPQRLSVTRSLAPQAYLWRRTARTLRIGNLSAGIVPPLLESQKERPYLAQTVDNGPGSPHQQGGRLRSESVAAFDRIGWPPSVGITGRLASDSARWRWDSGIDPFV